MESRRAIAIACLLTFALATVLNIAVSSLIIQRGLRGDKGEQGIQGLTGITGPKGDKGDQGAQGIQGVQGIQGTPGIQGIQGIQGSQGPRGLQGIQGIPGGITPYISGDLSDKYTDVWWPFIDHHTVSGYLINFGANQCYNVQVTMTWYMGQSNSIQRSYSINNFLGNQINYISLDYDFDGQGLFTYSINWTA